jgi:type II secretory ATPase GspE/PulE/Tfp pilus assembly ATPase PilB-like protein
VRRVCPECRGTGRLPDAESADGTKRCRNCSGSGFRGRVGIYELMAVNDEIRHAINAHKDTSEIAAIARRNGMRSLREDGAHKVRDGITTAAEVARVCQLDFAD